MQVKISNAMSYLTPTVCFSALSAVYVGHALISTFKVDDELDEATEALLTSSPTVPTECEAIVSALENAPIHDNPTKCAEQMRSIVSAGHLEYSSLIHQPEVLLRCSKGLEGQNGALYTRFTVQYNLYGGSIVALGTDEQRSTWVDSQKYGALGCFAFTEKGAGVLSGAGVETTAIFDKSTDEFIIHSPTPSSTKNWISQGMYAEYAVILANLIVDGISHGPHLFWAQIADNSLFSSKLPTSRSGVQIKSNPAKTTMHGLDNGQITFNQFRVPRSTLLSRYSTVTPDGEYIQNLPSGCKRMLDVCVFKIECSRLLTGRIVLSEATLSFAMSRLRRSWKYVEERILWKGKSEKGKKMSTLPLMKQMFRDYGRTNAIIAAFTEETRESVVKAIQSQFFPPETIEATWFGIDCISAIRKTLGARALQVDSWLGHESFLPNATAAAEGDNTIMELKVVQDVVRGRIQKFPLRMMFRLCFDSRGRKAMFIYLKRFIRALLLQKKAIRDGQLLRDIAWARAHMRVIDVWLQKSKNDPKKYPYSWLESYDTVLLRFPTPLQV